MTREHEEVEALAGRLLIVVRQHARTPLVAGAALAIALIRLIRTQGNIPDGKDEYDVAAGTIALMKASGQN